LRTIEPLQRRAKFPVGVELCRSERFFEPRCGHAVRCRELLICCSQKFSLRLFEFAGREHVWAMLEPIKRQFDRVRWLLLGRVAEHASHTLQEHELILSQMAARDVAGLGATVASHINHITEHVAALRSQAPESYFTD